MNITPDAKTVKQTIEAKLSRNLGCTPAEATKEQMYKAVVMTVKDILSEKRINFRNKVNKKGGKRVYYMCIEFLLGRSLKTNLHNLELDGVYADVLKDMGFKLEDLYDCEPDAGLGNGGLGRLAACFMDSLSSLDYPATGFSLCYEYGLFKQRIIDGMQVELPDNWLPGGEVWLVPRTDRKFTVKFGGEIKEVWHNDRLEILYEGAEELEAVPYDMMISGHRSEAVSQLRLWKAKTKQQFNMGLFTQGQYTRALEMENNAAMLTKVLYPSDSHDEGKLLRLTQQYFMVSASIQSIIRDHMAVYGRLDNLADKVSIHINDTHPALCIPELMRILIDEYAFSWEKAWDIVTRTVSYTNHTVMPEALETWREDLFRLRLPRIYMIIKEINERFSRDAWTAFPGNWDAISKMCIIGYGQIRMANLSVIASHSVNGVSKLHSDILKRDTFKTFAKMYPQKFDNVTNGVAHRRWLVYSNPRLAKLLDETIGPEYRNKPELLEELRKFENDSAVLDQIRAIKHQNKQDFAELLYKKTGTKIDSHSLYDVQIKRLHEYKRQLLNAINIITIYAELLENPNADVQPMTFFFGAKAASGYAMAKRIIQLICLLAKDIEKHPAIAEKLRVVFLEDYNVTMAEAIIPAAEISEQISLAGKEASGTGCMKFMINGALTIGTLDGANVEMLAKAGSDNMFIFGLNAAEVDELWQSGYNSASYYAKNDKLMKVIAMLNAGFAGESFSDISAYLLAGNGVADPYMCLADFESYFLTHKRMVDIYRNDKADWNRMSLMNIAGAGFFAADRSIEEYAQRIWGLEKIK